MPKFWETTKIDKKTFFNNLNYEIRKKYYSLDDIIDYDILDYTKFEKYTENGKTFVKVNADVRIVYFRNNKITSKLENATYILRKNEYGTIKLENGVNIIKCHNCGASVDVNKEKCDYCNTKIKYMQEWILEN